MNKKTEQILTVALCFGIIISGTAIVPTKTASAVHNCDEVDALIMGFSFGFVNKDKCSNNHVAHAIQELNEIDESQTKVDLHSRGVTQTSESQNFGATYYNYLQDSETVAWSKAEVAIVESFENGDTKATAKSNAKEAISDYYSVKQINLINSWNSTVLGYDQLRNRSEQEGFTDYVRVIDHASSCRDAVYDGTGTYAYSLVNGSSKTQVTVNWHGDNSDCGGASNAGSQSVHFDTSYVIGTYSDGSTWDDYTLNNQNNSYYIYSADGTNDDMKGMEVQAPNSDYDRVVMVNFADYVMANEEIKTKNSELQNEADAFVEAIWSDLEGGAIDSSDVLSKNTIMFQYGTDTQGSASYYDMLGATASMGLESPNINSTGTMAIDYKGGSHEGILFGNVSSGTWQVGTTYNTTNISGPVLFARTDGTMLDLNGEFTLKSATTKSGDSKDSVDTQTYNYQTSNTTELQETLDRLNSLNAELEARKAAIGSGGGGSGDSTNNNFTLPSWLTQTFFGVPMYGFILVGIGALFVWGKSKN